MEPWAPGFSLAPAFVGIWTVIQWVAAFSVPLSLYVSLSLKCIDECFKEDGAREESLAWRRWRLSPSDILAPLSSPGPVTWSEQDKDLTCRGARCSS